MRFTDEEIKRAHAIAKKMDIKETVMVKRALEPMPVMPHPPSIPRPPSMLTPSNVGLPAAPVPQNFGNLEGNPNLWADRWPRYNQPPPAFLEAQHPETFGESLRRGVGGLWRTGMGYGAAATVGQHGMPGMLEQTPSAIWQGLKAEGRTFAQPAQNPYIRQALTHLPHWAQQPLASVSNTPYALWRGVRTAVNSPAWQLPLNRAKNYSYGDRGDAMAPLSWLGQGARNVGRGVRDYFNTGDQ